jgi:proton-dependent oligopeptide transporter, POT family
MSEVTNTRRRLNPRRPKIAHLHFKQPKVLYLSSITSMFERFGYYIIGFLLTLYVKQIYNFSDGEAFTTFALFTALGYLTPAIGGFLADRFIGIKRCLGLGLAVECIGYALLAIPTPNIVIFHLALGCIIVGAGIFKTAPTNILGRAYDENDHRIDSGFTLYYMGINIGSLASALVAGTIQKSYGWHIPFLFAAVGLLIGFIWFLFLKHWAKEHESAPGKVRYGLRRWIITLISTAVSIALFSYLMSNAALANICFYIGSAAIFLYFIYEIIISPKDEKVRILVCLALIFMAVIFFLLYFQLYTSVELFIERNVNRQVLGFEMPTIYFLGMNGLWIIILSPIFAYAYKSMHRRNCDLAITTKFPLGILLIAASFFTLTIACNYFASSNALVGAWWVVLFLFLYSSGELLTSALGVAMITRIAPERMYGIMMGAWYLIALALAAELSGSVAKLADIPLQLQGNAHASLGIYSNAFFMMGILGAATAIAGFIVSPWLKRAAKLD